MPQLIGTAPNQVPTNGDLGSAAYMDTSAFYSTGLNPVFRNRIINGDMRIDQRNAGAAVLTTPANSSSVYVLDRWSHEYNSSSPAFTVQQVVDAPTGSGFRYSLKHTCTTAGTTGQVQQIKQSIEGHNLLDLAWGTANAQPITVSFWAKASIAGTYTAHMRIPGTSSNFQPFVLTSANTWQYCVVTFPGSTANPIFSSTNGEGIVLRIFMSSFGLTAGPIGVWTNSFDMVQGQVDLTKVAGSTFNLTGVQLEKGTVATPFEHRPIATELALCQRYFCSSFPLGTAPANNVGGEYQINLIASGDPQIVVQFPVQMRATPSVTLYNPNRASPAGQWDRGAVYSSANARSFGESATKTCIDNLDNALTAGYIGIAWSATAEF
jgi:hypothetical protein